MCIKTEFTLLYSGKNQMWSWQRQGGDMFGCKNSVLVKPLKVKGIDKTKRWKSAAVLICVEGPANLNIAAVRK